MDDVSDDLMPVSILDRRNLVRARTSPTQLPPVGAAWELRGGGVRVSPHAVGAGGDEEASSNACSLIVLTFGSTSVTAIESRVTEWVRTPSVWEHASEDPRSEISPADVNAEVEDVSPFGIMLLELPPSDSAPR